MESLSIRYEGNDADTHQIDLNQLGVSLQGLARILAVSAHFVQTGKYNKQYGALSVQVLASPVQEHNCYEVLAVIQDATVQAGFWSGFSGAALTAVVAVVLSRGRGKEMKLLNEALQKSLAQNAELQARMLDTVDRMVAALQSDAKRAHAPVDSSIETISIRNAGEESSVIVLDRETKARVNADAGNTIEDTKTYIGVITELDMISGACRVALDQAVPEDRTAALVTDPCVRHPNNPYVRAMAGLQPLRFQAKAECDANGLIVKLHISDTA